MSWLLSALLLYTILVAAAWLWQDRLLYFPSPGGAGLARAFGLTSWPSQAPMRGWVSIEPPPDPVGTVLVWHGNAGSALDRAYYPRALEARGWRVVLLEFPGYGGRPGDLGEKSFVADAEAALRSAAEEFGGPLLALGESMGGGVATAMAARHPELVDGVILITPWSTLPDLAQSAYPFLPARWIARDRFDNLENLRRYDGPVAVALAEHDEVIPGAHSRRLYDSIRSPKRRWIFAGRGHNDWPTAPDDPWWDEVLEFLESERRRSPRAG